MQEARAARPKSRLNARDMAYIALLAVLIAVCTWISIPAMVPFTLQTFGVSCALGLLGGRRGTLAVLTYILLGVVGLPVFSGFRGSIGVLLGTTGGYIVGFVISALAYWLLTRAFGTGTLAMLLSMIAGHALCYVFGTAWFILVYAGTTGGVGIVTALGWCVFPFVIPDLIKISLAVLLTKRVSGLIK